jgi:hypothetical protein
MREASTPKSLQNLHTLSHFGTPPEITPRIVTSDLVFQTVSCLTSAMVRIFHSRIQIALSLFLLIQASATAATKPHIVTFGKWTTIRSSPSTNAVDDKPLTLKVRPLLIDAHVKEFTLGPAHDVTDRLFVVRRAFRVNDSLPQESPSPPHWEWQRGGWLLVDRVTGRISPINLPEFDAFYSSASWYRDYAAYCGVSEDGKKIYAIVAQINRRKPVLKKALDGQSIPENAAADSACLTPAWQRSPARVTFEPAGAPKQTFAIRGHVVDLVVETEEPETEEASK